MLRKQITRAATLGLLAGASIGLAFAPGPAAPAAGPTARAPASPPGDDALAPEPAPPPIDVTRDDARSPEPPEADPWSAGPRPLAAPPPPAPARLDPIDPRAALRSEPVVVRPLPALAAPAPAVRPRLELPAPPLETAPSPALAGSIGRVSQQGAALRPDLGVHGFVKVTAGDYFFQGEPRDDARTRGFSVDAARVTLDGRVEDVLLYLSMDASGGAGTVAEGGGYLAKGNTPAELEILDAWAELLLTEGVSLRVGRFRAPVLYSNLIETNELLFVDRTYSGLYWQRRDEGLMLHGTTERLAWWLVGQNGRDGLEEDLSATARLTWRLFGEGEAPRREGAFDADLGSTLYLGAAWHGDGSSSEDAVLAGEAYYTFERLALMGEIADYGDAFLGETLWSVSGALMLVPETWELAARYEDFDQRAGGLVRVGLNRYLRGRSLRWQAGLARFDGDGHGLDAVQLGFVASL